MDDSILAKNSVKNLPVTGNAYKKSYIGKNLKQANLTGINLNEANLTEADTNLSQEDKVEALEQVKSLAEAGQNPQEGAMQKAAKTAMKILKGTVAGLPTAATLYEACNKLLPAIASLLGLA